MDQDLEAELRETRELLCECTTLIDAALLIGAVEDRGSTALDGHLGSIASRAASIREKLQKPAGKVRLSLVGRDNINTVV